MLVKNIVNNSCLLKKKDRSKAEENHSVINSPRTSEAARSIMRFKERCGCNLTRIYSATVSMKVGIDCQGHRALIDKLEQAVRTDILQQFFSAESGSAIGDSVKQRAHRHILPV